MNDQEWNEQIKQHNESALETAKRMRDLKQAALLQVLAAQKTLIDAFRDEGELRDMPEGLADIALRLGTIVRELDVKEQVELLGQEVGELRVALPTWAQAK